MPRSQNQEEIAPKMLWPAPRLETEHWVALPCPHPNSGVEQSRDRTREGPSGGQVGAISPCQVTSQQAPGPTVAPLVLHVLPPAPSSLESPPPISSPAVSLKE